ncbi:MAG TPA: histidine kinase, partial [Microlunatus sp.]|nr:histidine kinase [Microlunatus sp.]
MGRALVVLTAAALLVVVLEVANAPQALAAIVLAGLYSVIAIVGFRLVETRPRLVAVGYVAVQLLLGFAVFDVAGAGVGATLLLLVLVIQAVLLLPIRGAVVVALLIPLVHVGMGLAEGLREMASMTVAVGFAFVLAALHLREQQSKADLAEANQRLRAYADQTEALATQTERTRVAREIHDGLGHHLTVVQMQIRAARSMLVEDRTRAEALLDGAEHQARAALAEVRRSVAALREPWEDRPLAQAIEKLGSESATAGLPTVVEVLGTARPLNPQTARVVYRAAQEGLTNARRHSGAESARVVLDYTMDTVVHLSVEDDGVGLPPEDDPSRAGVNHRPTSGYGLVGVRERVEGL